jgi:hypothetical protein
MRSNLKFSIVAVSATFFAMPSHSPAQDDHWQTPAKWHRTLKKAELGTLVLDGDGLEFRSLKFSHRWKYVEIRSFDLSQRELTLLTYENRGRHEPGERPFRFSLGEGGLPPEIAAQLADRVGKPVRNGAPLPTAQAVEEIPAHHRTWSGGSNGTLRMKDEGIDYVTENGRDSRSWRWTDIQTIANPNPYELRVAAFREIFEFDLKQPLARPAFDRMWDLLYAPGLNLSVAGQDVHP